MGLTGATRQAAGQSQRAHRQLRAAQVQPEFEQAMTTAEAIFHRSCPCRNFNGRAEAATGGMSVAFGTPADLDGHRERRLLALLCMLIYEDAK
jgi:hypothetical protein